jgi:hypothetical protein
MKPEKVQGLIGTTNPINSQTTNTWQDVSGSESCSSKAPRVHRGNGYGTG